MTFLVAMMLTLLNTKTSWSNEDLAVLHAYRHAYRLNHPSAFQSPMSNAIFSYPGIGKYSPTMARSKERRKTTKEQLALAVRKHFNSMAVNETDVVTEFLYKTKNHGAYELGFHKYI